MMNTKKRKRIAFMGTALLLASAACIALLLHLGILQFNDPSKEKYPVRGVDVSEYQGEIDWPLLSKQGISFAFIKATEGSQYVDPRFVYNWEHAAGTGLKLGAYHFFSFDSPGSTQAENFLSTVNRLEGMLPPVVDIEMYGQYKRTPKLADEVWTELTAMLNALEAEYGAKPILYATQAAYDLYLDERYEDYPLWIRSVYTYPAVKDWTFWQYSDRMVLKGYSGVERHIDMNLYDGTKEAFEREFP